MADVWKHELKKWPESHERIENWFLRIEMKYFHAIQRFGVMGAHRSSISDKTEKKHCNRIKNQSSLFSLATINEKKRSVKIAGSDQETGGMAATRFLILST